MIYLFSFLELTIQTENNFSSYVNKDAEKKEGKVGFVVPTSCKEGEKIKLFILELEISEIEDLREPKYREITK